MFQLNDVTHLLTTLAESAQTDPEQSALAELEDSSLNGARGDAGSLLVGISVALGATILHGMLR